MPRAVHAKAYAGTHPSWMNRSEILFVVGNIDAAPRPLHICSWCRLTAMRRGKF
jgi:hypothetical protein